MPKKKHKPEPKALDYEHVPMGCQMGWESQTKQKFTVSELRKAGFSESEVRRYVEWYLKIIEEELVKDYTATGRLKWLSERMEYERKIMGWEDFDSDVPNKKVPSTP